jgi:hypothetical protein
MVDQPKKVSGYKVEWLGETYYCSKRSEVGEWLQGLLESHEGHEDVDLSEEPRISRVTMWRIYWEDWSEDYRSKDEAAEALRDLQIQADMARNPEAFEEVPDLHWDIFHPFELWSAVMHRPDHVHLFATVSGLSIQAAFDAGRLWCSRGRMNPMERACWFGQPPIDVELRLACVHGWLDRDFEYRHRRGKQEERGE